MLKKKIVWLASWFVLWLGSRLILEWWNSLGVIVILEEARERTRSYVVLVLSLNSPYNCKHCVVVVLRRNFGRWSSKRNNFSFGI